MLVHLKKKYRIKLQDDLTTVTFQNIPTVDFFFSITTLLE